MTIFEKARELSFMFLETDEYKAFQRAKLDYENKLITKEELVNVTKSFNDFIEQIFTLIKFNIDDELETKGCCCKNSCNK